MPRIDYFSSLFLLILLLPTAPALPESGGGSQKEKTVLMETEKITEGIKKVDLLLRAVNAWAVTLNSYISAFSNILKEYRVVEVLGVAETIFSFIFSGEHLLTFLFLITFFLLILDE